MLEPAQQVAEVLRQRPDVAHMDVAHVAPLAARIVDRAVDRAERAAPTDDRELARGIAEAHFLVGYGDAVDLALAQVGHALVVVGRIVDIAAQLVLLDPADAVHQAGRPGLDPGPCALLVALVGQEGLDPLIVDRVLLGQELCRERFERGRIGHFPRLGGIGDIAIGEQHDGGHILHRDAARLDRHLEGIARAAGGNHRHRCIAIAAIDRLVEIALLGLGRQACGRAAALRVDDHQRQFGHDREAHRLALERNARTRRTGDPEATRIAGTDGGADCGNFVFRLEGGDVEFLEPREMVQDRAGGSDRVAAEEHRQAGQLCARDQA